MKKVLSFLLMAILLAISGKAQSNDTVQITIGIGDYGYNNSTPVSLWYSYTASQTIYLASELNNTSGNITSISFKNTSQGTNNRNIKVYLATTSLSYFSSQNDALPEEDFILVYDSVWTITGEQFSQINLASPFPYDGTSNLVVGIVDYTGSFAGNEFYWQSTNSNTARTVYKCSDENTLGVSDVTTGVVDYACPDIKLSIYETDDICTPITNVQISNITTESATISWAANDNASLYYYQIKADTASWVDGGNESTSDTTINFDNLTANTTYNVRIKTECTSSTSLYKNITFTTACDNISELPWTTSFEDDETEAMPSCWTSIYPVNGYPAVGTILWGTTYSRTGANQLDFRNSDNTKSFAVLPIFETSLDSLQLSFYTRREGSASGTFQVGYITDITDTSTFVALETITAADLGDNDYHLYEIPFANIEVEDEVTPRIAFSYTSYNNFWWFVDDIIVETLPECTRPAHVTSLASSTSANINWTSTGEDFVVYYRESSSTDEDDWQTSTTFSSTGIDSFSTTLSNLTPNTKYNYYVVAICTDSIYSETKSFKTPCTPYTTVPQSWDFETYDTETGIPSCWSKTVAGAQEGAYTTMGQWVSGSSSLCLYGTTNVTVLPGIDTNELSLNDLQIRFKGKGSDYFTQTPVQVGVVTDPTDPNTFQSITTINLSPYAFEEKTAMFSSYEGNGIYIALKLSGSSSYISAYIDDLYIEDVPTCPAVQNVAVSNLTSDSATISWTGVSNAYRVRYKQTLSTEYTDSLVTTESSVVLSNLSANTEYFVEVAPDCDETTDSLYNGITFTTVCATVNVPYLMDFETESLLNCWTIASQSSFYMWSTTYYPKLNSYNAYAHNGSKSWTFGGDNTAPMIIAAPKVNLNIEQTRLKFYVRKAALTNYSYAYQFGNIEVGVMTDPNDTSTFVSLYSVMDSSITETYSLKTIDFNQFTNYTGSSYYIAIRYLGTGTTWGYNSGEYYIDEIAIDNIPSCEEPTNVTLSNITSNSIDLSWTSQSSEFIVYYKDASLDDNALYEEQSASLVNGTYTLENLTPATTYKLYIASVCSDGTESNSELCTFTTACVALSIPYTQNFESIEEDSRPLCWSFINSVTDSYYGIERPCVDASQYRGHLSSKGLMFASTSYENSAAIAVLPEFSTDLNQLSLVFWTRPGELVYSGHLDVGYVTDPTDASTFVTIDSINTTNLTDTAYHRYRINFNLVTLQEGETGYIALRHVTNSSYYYWFVDDIRVENIPGCTEPTALRSSNASSTSINLTWNAVETSVTLYYKESSATEFDSIENVSLDEDGIYLLSDLTPNTEYDWKISFVCSADAEIYTSETTRFATACSGITTLPQTWDFEATNNTAGTTSNPLPACWQRNVNNIYPYCYNYSYYAHEGNFSLFFYDSNPAVLPLIDTALLPINTLQLSLYARCGSYASSSSYIAVGVMTDPQDASTFTTVANIPLTSTYTLYNIPLITYSGEGTYIAIKNTSTSSYSSIYVDDVTLDLVPSCSSPFGLSLQAGLDTISLSWYSTGDDFVIYYKENSSSVYDSITTFSVGEESNSWQASISGLNSGTAYDVYVKVLCDDDSELTSSVASIRTECGSVIGYPYTENFESLTTEDLGCWTSQIISGTYSWDIQNNSSTGNKVAHRTYNTGSTRLVSPIFDMTSLDSPTLSYNYEACSDVSYGGLDSLYVYYRTSSEDDWILLASHGSSMDGSNYACNVSQSNIINLPNTTSTYQIAFVAVGNSGYGVYLDNVVVDGTTSIPPTIDPTVATNVASSVAQTSATL
ncbi:MAG: fibronectin type III domain-containing protein, partial [Bacteroidota bacterium]|nr:fibronectin type III domain-containing protein [Bacteroidota bacterium]